MHRRATLVLAILVNFPTAKAWRRGLGRPSRIPKELVAHTHWHFLEASGTPLHADGLDDVPTGYRKAT
jgi:hypothetical protein